MSEAEFFLRLLVYQFPGLAVYIVAIALAIARRRLLGWASALTGLGAGLWAVAWLASSSLQWWISTAHERGVSPSDVGFYVDLLHR